MEPSSIKLISDLAWELQVYHTANEDCPKKLGLYCRICYIIDKANNYEPESNGANSKEEHSS